MAKKCGKCDPHEICEECPEWIFTLADLIMCMMGLFVILWVLKPGGQPTPQNAAQAQMQSEEWLEQVGDIRAGFGYVPDPNSSDPVDHAMIRKRNRLVGPGEKGTQTDPQDAADGTDPKVTSIRESKFAIVGTKVTFERGDATLSVDHKKVLDQIANAVRGNTFIVVVKGHASLDDLPDGTPQQAFMDLSSKRAQAAVEYLIALGVAPQKLRAQGCSHYEPVKEGIYTNDKQRVNRRVEIFSTDVTTDDLRDPKRVIRTDK